MNVECPSDANAGEDGIGALTFFVKLAYRLAPAIYGIGCVLAAGGLCVAPAMYMEGGEARSIGTDLAAASLVLTGIAALFPFLTYIGGLIRMVLFDAIGALLSIPGKLDALAQQSTRAGDGETNPRTDLG